MTIEQVPEAGAIVFSHPETSTLITITCPYLTRWAARLREVQHERQAQGDSPRALSLTPAEAMDLAKEWFAEVGHSGGVHAFAYEAFMETFDLAMAMGMADPCLTVADKGSGETSGASIGELS